MLSSSDRLTDQVRALLGSPCSGRMGQVEPPCKRLWPQGPEIGPVQRNKLQESLYQKVYMTSSMSNKIRQKRCSDHWSVAGTIRQSELLTGDKL
ncbi:hypothetical protein M8J75_012532 [Diaphorina citri]|nr:hypothetical protein M8J75_012532 [Diaphorina citri]